MVFICEETNKNMKLDLTTLKKIRAEVERMKAQPIGDRPLSLKNQWYNLGLTDLLHYLDTEIGNAKNHD